MVVGGAQVSLEIVFMTCKELKIHRMLYLKA